MGWRSRSGEWSGTECGLQSLPLQDSVLDQVQRGLALVLVDELQVFSQSDVGMVVVLLLVAASDSDLVWQGLEPGVGRIVCDFLAVADADYHLSSCEILADFKTVSRRLQRSVEAINSLLLTALASSSDILGVMLDDLLKAVND
ncbi:hypothetical protein KCU93_g373, partial [Aureobasidium melanogenum]